MKIGPNQERWLTALETTELPQGTDRLCSADGYCCLGIACVVFGDPNPDGSDLEDHPHVVEALALKNNLGSVTWLTNDQRNRLKQRKIDIPGLTALNDHSDLTFPQIASVVREFPELYFTEPR